MLVKVNEDSSIVFPYSRALAVKDYPNVSMPISMTAELWAEFGVFPVTVLSATSYDPNTHSMVRDAIPTFNQETQNWELGYQLNALTEEEVARKTETAKESARNMRDDLLRETDSWALSDRTMSQDQIQYRQALRDIPAQQGFPFNIEWPIKP